MNFSRSKLCWWIASVADLTTLKIIRQDIDAVLACSADDAHAEVAARNPRKPDEVFAVYRVEGRGAPALARTIRDLRTKTIQTFETLIDEKCK